MFELSLFNIFQIGLVMLLMRPKKIALFVLLAINATLKTRELLNIMKELNFAKIIVLNIFKSILDIMYYECSALNGENIDTIFTMMAKNIVNKVDDGTIELDNNRPKPLIIISPEISTENKQSYSCASC